MIPLDQLRSQAVRIEWHEAVAVVAALSDAVLGLSVNDRPSLQSAVLTAQGAVTFVSVVDHGDSPTAAGLASVLKGLLDVAPCPAELRQLAVRNAGIDPPLETVEAFAEALKFFERPDREPMLTGLARRAETALEAERVAAQFEWLAGRTRGETPSEAPPVARAAASPRSIWLATGAVLAFSVAAVATATLFSRVLTPAPAESVAIDLAPLPAVAPDSASGGAPTAAAASPRSSVASDDDAGRTASNGRPGAMPPPPAPRAAGGAAPATSAPQVETRVRELGGAPLAADVSSRAGGAVAPTPFDPHVYQAGDVDVEPAVLIKPHLPSVPPFDVPLDKVGVLELTVGVTGNVEQVRLISPLNRFQERMVVAAAKAWQFKPAARGGRPVRYRTEIRITL